MNNKPKILIIEDDADLVAAIRIQLEKKGYDIAVAYNPEEGKEKLNQEEVDLIILDVMFGSKGEPKGFDFAQKMRYNKQFSGIPILMLTAVNAQKPHFKFSPETDGEYLPVDSFLDKPVQSEELFRKVESLLQQKTSKWQNYPHKEE
ncbi:MAG: response regulator [Bacteroidales bacterium]|nr:response regulator [Bacteroidales bacterium]